MLERELPCDGCGTVTRFEAPPCPDGHGADCPELVCTGCGDAYLLATTPCTGTPAPRGAGSLAA